MDIDTALPVAIYRTIIDEVTRYVICEKVGLHKLHDEVFITKEKPAATERRTFVVIEQKIFIANKDVVIGFKETHPEYPWEEDGR